MGRARAGASGPFRSGCGCGRSPRLAPRSLGLREQAMPFLEDLFEVTRQNVQLAVLDGPRRRLCRAALGARRGRSGDPRGQSASAPRDRGRPGAARARAARAAGGRAGPSAAPALTPKTMVDPAAPRVLADVFSYRRGHLRRPRRAAVPDRGCRGARRGRQGGRGSLSSYRPAKCDPTYLPVVRLRREGSRAACRIPSRPQKGNTRGVERDVTHCSSVNSSAAKPDAEPAAPAVLDATERHLRLVVHGLVVDVHDARLQPPGELHPSVRCRRRECRRSGRTVTRSRAATASSASSTTSRDATGPKVSSKRARRPGRRR